MPITITAAIDAAAGWITSGLRRNPIFRERLRPLLRCCLRRLKARLLLPKLSRSRLALPGNDLCLARAKCPR